MADWQIFSISNTVSNNEGGKVTLPSLGGAKNIDSGMLRVLHTVY